MSTLWMGQSKVWRKRRPFCTSCCRSRDCLGVRKKIRRGNSKRNRSWCVEEVGKMGDNLPQHNTTTIMRGNRKRPNSNLKDVDLTEGVRNPMRPAWHTSSCGRITGFRRAAGFLTQESLRWSRAPLIARLRWSRSYLISLWLWLSEHSMAGNTTYRWLG